MSSINELFHQLQEQERKAERDQKKVEDVKATLQRQLQDQKRELEKQKKDVESRITEVDQLLKAAA